MFNNFPGKYDDDDDFGDSNSSTMLSKIFGISMETSPIDQQSLQYHPPKQPQTQAPVDTNNSANKSEWQTSLAKVVFAYKLVNQENIPQGKIGIAILKSIKNECKIILYRSKQTILATINIVETNRIYIKQQYLQFETDDQVFWSLIFDGDDRQLFLNELNGKCLIVDQETVPTTMGSSEKSQIHLEMDSSRSSILNRLAKMGKPLPQLASTVEVSDSSDTDEKTVNYTRRSTNKLVPITGTVSPLKSDSNALNNTIVPTTMSSGRVLTAYNPAALIQESTLNVLMSDNRTQNTEIRMNLSKIETKIEKILDKFDIMDCGRMRNLPGRSEVDRDDEIIRLEERLLEIKKDNRKLNGQLLELKEKCTSESSRSMVNSNEIERLNDEIQVWKTKDLNNQQMKQSFNEMKKEVELKNNRIEELEIEVLKVRSELNECNDAKAKSDLEKLNLKEEMEQLKFDIENRTKEPNCEMEQTLSRSLDDIVKEIMNNLYGKLQVEFGKSSTFEQSEALRIIGSLIKAETLAVLKGK